MARYSEERKEAVLRKMLPPDHRPLSELAAAEGISAATLYHWRRQARAKGSTLLATLQALGIAPAYSRPRVSDDNPFSEALFRTCKYRPDYPVDGFADLTAARAWMPKFVHWYNTEHRHNAIRFLTPHQRHSGQDQALLARCEALRRQARAHHPRRWSGRTRDWMPIGAVTLNARPHTESQREAA